MVIQVQRNAKTFNYGSNTSVKQYIMSAKASSLNYLLRTLTKPDLGGWITYFGSCTKSIIKSCD